MEAERKLEGENRECSFSEAVGGLAWNLRSRAVGRRV